MATHIITVNRGTTYVITHTYTKDGAESSDGATLRFTVKSVEYDDNVADSSAMITKDVAMSGATNTITLDPADTATLIPGTYYYDLKVEETGGDIFKVDEGRFKLDGSPTNRTS